MLWEASRWRIPSRVLPEQTVGLFNSDDGKAIGYEVCQLPASELSQETAPDTQCMIVLTYDHLLS